MVGYSRSTGKGTTNDGNTARRFFSNPEKTAEITGLNLELVKRFANILAAINCGQLIDADKFHNYAVDTAQLFVQEYPWYYLPSHTHKILLHGGEVMRNSLLPLGKLFA